MTQRTITAFWIVTVVANSAGISSVSASEPQSHYVLVQNALDKSVLPGFEALKTSAAKLPDAVARVCSEGNAPAIDDLNKASAILYAPGLVSNTCVLARLPKVAAVSACRSGLIRAV